MSKTCSKHVKNMFKSTIICLGFCTTQLIIKKYVHNFVLINQINTQNEHFYSTIFPLAFICFLMTIGLLNSIYYYVGQLKIK